MQKQNKLLSILLLITIVIQVITPILPSLVGGLNLSTILLGFLIVLPIWQIFSIFVLNLVQLGQFLSKFMYDSSYRPNYDQITSKYYKTQHRYFLFYSIYTIIIALLINSIFLPLGIFNIGENSVLGSYLSFEAVAKYALGAYLWFVAIFIIGLVVAAANIPASITYFIFTLDSYKLFKTLPQTPPTVIRSDDTDKLPTL